MQALLKAHEDYRTEVTKELKQVISSLSVINEICGRLDQIINVVDSLSKNISTVGTSEELTKEQADTISNLKVSIASLVKFAADMQGAITMHNGSIQSTFVKTEDSLRRLIMKVTDRIENDYRDNLEAMFKAMDKNLRAILDRLVDDIDGKKGKNKK